MQEKQEIIGQIVKNRITCYFISPHLDDAVLSAGGLVSYLASKTSVKIITIFTEGTSGPYTFVMRRFLLKCGYPDAMSLYVARRKEDESVFKSLNIEPIHLGFVDGSFRTKHVSPLIEKLGKYLPELEHTYPLGRKLLWLTKDDEDLKEEIAKKLAKSIHKNENHVIFCPLGTVKHMDHEITREVCIELFPLLEERPRDSEGRGGKLTINLPVLIFWRDYPYITNDKKKIPFVEKNQLQTFTWNKNLEIKQKLIEGYTSQLQGMFPSGEIPKIPETYFF